jgi:hypothetical protein
VSTTVRIVCEVEVTVDTWDSKSAFDNLAKAAVREGRQKLEAIARDSGDIRLLDVKEVRFVTHSIPWSDGK